MLLYMNRYMKQVAQMQAVLKHPVFAADPLATIRTHLDNSLKAARA